MKILQFTRISELFVRFEVAPTLADGTPATITGVQCALLPRMAKSPTAATVWQDALYSAGVARVLVYGPDATDPALSYAFALPDGGGDLWARVVDSPEDVAEPVARIELLTD